MATDEIDRKLISLLQEDATLSVAQMAQRVGLSATPCWKRVQRLEALGVVTGRVALVDPAKVGVGLAVFVAIEAGDHSPEWLVRFSAIMSDLPQVVAAYRVAGEMDYLLQVLVADMAEFDAFYKTLIEAARPRNVTSRFAMERLKHTTAVPLHPSAFRDRRRVEEADEEGSSP